MIILVISARFTAYLSVSDFAKKLNPQRKKVGHIDKYDTPKVLGIKRQMNVKYVPTIWYSGKAGQKFYQYTIIEEGFKEALLLCIYAYEEQSGYSIIDFVKRAASNLAFQAFKKGYAYIRRLGTCFYWTAS